MKNKAHMFRLSEELSLQWIANGPQLVDLFFVISGFLMSHNFLKNRQQIEQIRTDGVGANLKRFGRIVLQRYLRYHLDFGQFYILIC
jgi:peptidoglycan/LPS O-acetylase OafA/YrhL